MANWTQVEIETSAEGIEVLSAMLAEMNLGSIAIQDPEDFKDFIENRTMHWDYIDDELMNLQQAPTMVTVYLSDLEQGEAQMALLNERLKELQAMDTTNAWGKLTYQVKTVHEEDWASAWKQYYHPTEIGKRLIICPTWEDCSPKEKQVVVKMDPGMAFGTGTHESTRLCLELLDDISVGGERILDIGCGSGILAISAILLGGASAEGIDIDEMAVKVATENTKENHLQDKISLQTGSFVEHATGTYNIIFANIVADAIKQLVPEIPALLAEGGSFIASGIIDTRSDEVEEAMKATGLQILEKREDAGWVAFRASH